MFLLYVRSYVFLLLLWWWCYLFIYLFFFFGLILLLARSFWTWFHESVTHIGFLNWYFAWFCTHLLLGGFYLTCFCTCTTCHTHTVLCSCFMHSTHCQSHTLHVYQITFFGIKILRNYMMDLLIFPWFHMQFLLKFIFA